MATSDDNIVLAGWQRINRTIESRITSTLPLPKVVANIVVLYIKQVSTDALTDHFKDVLAVPIKGEWRPRDKPHMFMTVELKSVYGDQIRMNVYAESMSIEQSNIVPIDSLYLRVNFNPTRLAALIQSKAELRLASGRRVAFDIIDNNLAAACQTIAISLCALYTAMEAKKTIIIAPDPPKHPE